MGLLKWPAAGQTVFSSSATQVHPLGARGEDRFGRTFRYAQAGDTLLVAGDCLQASAQIANHQDMAVDAAAVGDKTLNLTPGATAGAANLYADGFAIIDTTPGIGYSYPIKGHAAITASTEFTVTLVDGWPVQVALTTDTRVTLQANPYKNVIQTPVTTLTSGVVGVCTYPIAATEYGWIGVNGAFGTKMNSGTAAAVGTAVGCPSAAAGAATGVSGVLQHVGVILDTLQDAHVQAVKWVL